MVVGDIITDQQTVNNTSVDFVPAATVEIMITWVCWNDNSATSFFKMFDGVQDAWIMRGGTGTREPSQNTLKLGITNTNYLRMQNTAASNVFMGYSGVQIK